ncbi:MAG TPA: sulfur transferase domain-containing protein [Candidatus Eisenbacteria bacterium]|nr:sulfur transferase domain-containing protein [Candidatus Eisenbacteria bacterium]
MNVRHRLVAAARFLPFLVFGLVASAAAVASTPVVEDPLLSQLTDVQNACRPYPWLVTGGQPNEDALEALAQAGIHDVYDLRGAGEPRGFDEPAVVRSMNLDYLSIPVTPADFTDSKFTAFRHHLIAHGPDNPMFIHCGSGNRVGAALLPWLVLDKGLSEDAALELARTVGLQSPEMTKRALAYIRTHDGLRQ